MRILICRLSAHGDIIQTLPLLNTLRTLFPQAFIGWLVESSGLPLLAHHPQLNAVHELPLKAIKRDLSQGKCIQAAQAWRQAAASIRQQAYTVSIDPQGLLKSAVMPWWLGIPQRVGFDKTREQAARFYTHRMPQHDMYNPEKRTLEWFNGLAAALLPAYQALPQAQYVLSPVNPALAKQATDALAALPGPVIALAPGTIWPSKQWPHWSALFTMLADRSVILVGGPGEVDTVNGWISTVFNGKLPLHWQNWAGKTDWPMLHALLTQVDELIGPDSAPLHLADAISAQPAQHGKPAVIGLFGPTAPGRTGPVGPLNRTLQTSLPCQPCFKRRCPLTGDAHQACLQQLTPQAVLDMLQTVLP